MRERAFFLIPLLALTLLGSNARTQDPYETYERMRKERSKEGEPTTQTPGVKSEPVETSRLAPIAGEATWGRTKNATKVHANHDSASPEVRGVEAGTFLKIWGETSGYYRVQVPGGFPAWIHESLVAPTELEGQLKVTGTRVYVRSSASRTAIPVEPDRFEPGDKLLVQERQGEWFRVVTPGRIQAWVPVKDVELVADTEDNEIEWGLQAMSYARERVAEMETYGEKLERNHRILEARRKYEKLHELVALEAQKGASADLTGLAREYGMLRTEHPDAELVPDYQKGMELIDKARVLVEATKRSIELQATAAETEKVAKESGARVAEDLESSLGLEKSPSPIARSYQAFGWLRQRGGLLDQAVYFELERGGQRAYYIECHSGRYDLTDYVGREIAVSGESRETPRGRVFDVDRIRILTNPR